MQQRHEILTWDDVDKLIDLLLPQLRGVGHYDAMMMITRGGIVPGGMLSEALGIHTVLTAAVNFPAEAEQAGLMAWPKFFQFPDDSILNGQRILCVDDVWGSGRTSTAVRSRVEAAGGTPFTCVLHYNPYRSMFSKAQPDFYAAVTEAYIVYPWELDRGTKNLDLPTPAPQIS
jgi:uncharacterized protein